MKPQTLDDSYIEHLSDSDSRPKKSFVPLLWLGRIWKAIAPFIISSNEPKIRAIANRFGEVRWIVYDPITRYQTTLNSEDEVRIWLDNRYL